ncbi:MAG: VWA domain-containing protein [Kiloniellales bacterium]|nr:VWA domain-containing protein [Kiloniellales bacterium]
MAGFLEAEEGVGRWWHRRVGEKSSYPSYPEAAVAFEDLAGMLGVVFRGLGGDPGIQVSSQAPQRSGHRLTLRQRLGRTEESLERACLRGDKLLLPRAIAAFPDRELNRALYLWNAAFLAASPPPEPRRPADPLQADLAFLRRALQTTEALLSSYPGLRPSHERLCRALLKERPRRRLPETERRVEDLVLALLGDPAAQAAAASSVEVLRDSEDSLAGLRAPAGYRRFLPLPLWGEVAAETLDGANSEASEDGTAGAVEELGRGQLRKARRKRQERSERGDPLILNRFETILSWAEMLNLSRKVEDDDSAAAKKALDDADEVTLTRHHKRAATRLRFDLDLSPLDPDAGPIEEGLLYPEWDFRRGAYHPDHCRVFVDASRPDPAPWQPSEESRRQIRRVRRYFEALRPKREVCNRQLDGAELDMDAVIRARCDLMASGRGSNRVYLQARDAARDLAVAVLIDLSLSTDSWVDNRRVLDVEKEALTSLGYGLQASGDANAIYGFTSRKRSMVLVTTVKAFEESMGPQVEQRIGALKPGYYTRIGAALRHVSSLLEARPNRYRLLLLLTDGKPNDLDHYEGRYGVEDTRQAVREAARKGQTVFAVTVDRNATEYLPHMFGRGRFAVVPRLSKLVTALPAIYRSVTS